MFTNGIRCLLPVVCGLYFAQCYDSTGLSEYGKNSLYNRGVRFDATPSSAWDWLRNIKVKREKGMLSIGVYWSHPCTNDSKVGSVKIHKMVSKNHQGDSYQGQTEIGYFAFDRNENIELCSFTIHVAATRCPSFELGPGLIRVCTDYDDRLGSKCEFDCKSGYSLFGEHQLECQYDGRWNGELPLCKEFCPPLPAKNESFSYICTNEFEYGSECSFICPPGFDIPQGENRLKLCTNDGNWQGSFPPCIDVSKPKILNCNPFADGTADKNSSSGRIYWDEPSVYDNADKIITLKKTGGISPGDKIEAGTYQVTYTAVDQSGNKSRPCTVTLTMKVYSCPPLFDNNFLSVNCPWGYRYGAQCYFSCRIGSVLVGTNITNCVKSRNGKYVDWDFGKTYPYCEVFRACANDPIPPKNGAVACDSWLDGKFCQVQCQKGFDFKPGYPFYEMLVCGYSGKDRGQWIPENAIPIPDCSKQNDINTATIKMDSYYDGDCTNSGVQENIRQNYINSLSNSTFKDVCLKYTSQCKTKHVKILCGS